MRLISIILLLLLIIPMSTAYEFKENGYRMYADFTSGGLSENRSGYNASMVLGGSQTPFNSTIGDSEVKQGLYYTLLLTGTYIDIGAILDFIFSIKDFGIEWVKINWTG